MNDSENDSTNIAQLKEPVNSIWFPQPGPQSEAIQATWVNELLFGGSRGGGKSDFLLGDWLQDVDRYGEAWQGVIFRKTYDELKHLIQRSHTLFPKGKDCYWRAGDKEWRWNNGAILRFRYLDSVYDAARYQGHEYVWVGWDELGEWATDEAYKMLIACLRSRYDVPTKRIRATANPGGVGHHWVKSRFIDEFPRGNMIIDDPDTNMIRMFMPSSVTQNKILLSQDPDYIQRLKGVGSPELVRAWLEGDWNIIKGAYFPEFDGGIHVIDPVKIPSHWLRFRAFDFGSSAPFACVWFAVSDGELPFIPKKCLVVYREWYGARAPNKGLKMRNELIAQGIKEREDKGEKIAYSVADPSMFKEEGGPSVAEVFYREGVNFYRADNERLAGWTNLRSRLVGDDDGPQILFFSTCKEIIRTLPALQHDSKKPEDVDTEGDDHLADAIRYGIQSRPYVQKEEVHEGTRTIKDITLNELWKVEEESRRSLWI